MKLRLFTLPAVILLLLSCGVRPETFNPELYPWEAARDSIEFPSTAWIIHCGSPDRAIYRFSQERLAPGVASADNWLFRAFMLCEEPCKGEDLPSYWLNPVYGTVPALEKAVSAAAERLGEPEGKRYFTVSLQGAGDDECFACIDRVREMTAALDCPHLELLGFTFKGEISERVQRYAAACHELLLEEKASVEFDYSVVEDIMDQPGVKSMDGKYTLQDVPARRRALENAMKEVSGNAVFDCGINCLAQLSRSPYASDKALLGTIYDFIVSLNEK